MSRHKDKAIWHHVPASSPGRCDRAWRWEGDRRVWRSTEARGDEAKAVVERWEREAATGTLREFAADFFIPGRCPYLAWKSHLKAHTIYEHRRNLTAHILPLFGSRPLGEPTEPEIEAAVGNIAGLSGSTRNGVLNTYRLLMVEAKRARRIPSEAIPKFRRFAKHSARRDILTAAECGRLFPDDADELAAVWRLAPHDSTALAFGLLFRTMLHAGLRPGEARALSREQLYPEQNGILIDRQLDSSGDVALPKKGTAEDPRHRLVVVPAKTMALLVAYADAQEIHRGLLFLVAGKPITKDMVRHRWGAGLKRAKVKTGDRILQPYSLRYTYRSMAQNRVDGEALRGFMGHRSLGMSDHYLQVSPEQLAALKKYQQAVESMWA